MAVKKFNRSLAIVRKAAQNPGIYTLPELVRMFGGKTKNNGYRYLIDTGVLVYTGKAKASTTRTGMTVRVGKVGREKLAFLDAGGAMPSQ